MCAYMINQLLDVYNSAMGLGMIKLIAYYLTIELNKRRKYDLYKCIIGYVEI